MSGFRWVRNLCATKTVGKAVLETMVTAMQPSVRCQKEFQLMSTAPVEARMPQTNQALITKCLPCQRRLSFPLSTVAKGQEAVWKVRREDCDKFRLGLKEVLIQSKNSTRGFGNAGQ